MRNEVLMAVNVKIVVYRYKSSGLIDRYCTTVFQVPAASSFFNPEEEKSSFL